MSALPFERMDGEDEISQNLVSYSGDIFNRSDAERFLEIVQIDKVPSIRYLCWMIVLKLIPGERVKWIPELCHLADYYDRCLRRYFKTNYGTPLDDLIDSPKIRYACEQNIDWFKGMVNDMEYQNFDKHVADDSLLRIERMIAVAILDNTGYTFVEGDELIFMVTYLVALGFARRGILSNVYAEAMGYHMGRQILGLIMTHRKLNSLGAAQDYDAEFWRLLDRFVPKMREAMRKAESDPLAIERHWTESLFTEVHSTDSLLLLWDQVLTNISDFRSYINYLTIAHFREAAKTGCRIEKENIIPDQPFDIVEIIYDVEAMQHEKEFNPWNFIINAICPCYQGYQAMGKIIHSH